MLSFLLGLGLMATTSVMGSTSTTSGEYPATTSQDISSSSIRSLITHYSGLYGVSGRDMTDTVQCESNFNAYAINPVDPSYGVAQFGTSTFYWYAQLSGIDKPDIWDVDDQIHTMGYMWSKGLAYRWTCARRLGYLPSKGG